jgi:hypothetical protein
MIWRVKAMLKLLERIVPPDHDHGGLHTEVTAIIGFTVSPKYTTGYQFNVSSTLPLG